MGGHFSFADFSFFQWAIAFLCAFLIGLSKTGMSGAGIMVIPLMAMLFGGRMSTGVLLPMLIMADVFAVTYYRRHGQWKYIFRLLPWALAGILVGLTTGKNLDDILFKKIIAGTVIVSLGINIIQQSLLKYSQVVHRWWFTAFFGLLGGFSTMVGNSAGPVMNVYLISMDLPKTVFVGTAAWFFALVNVLKLPLQWWGWNNITRESLWFNAMMIPAIAAGCLTGIIFLKRIPETLFRYVIFMITAGGALYLLFS